MFGPLLAVHDVGNVHAVVARSNDSAPFPKVGTRGTFEEDLRRCIAHGRRSRRDMFIKDVRRSGRSLPETGCILEHGILRFAKMSFCVTGCSALYDLAPLFRGRCNALDEME